MVVCSLSSCADSCQYICYFLDAREVDDFSMVLHMVLHAELTHP